MSRPVRRWVHRLRRPSHVDVHTIHPKYGQLYRGRLAVAGVADTPGPGLAGTLVWRGTDPDYADIGLFTGNYIAAERWLLAASPALDLT